MYHQRGGELKRTSKRLGVVTIPLVDFGKEWNADDVQVYTGESAERLLNARGEALPVVRYWWD